MPISRSAASTTSYGKPPPGMSHAYAATVPPGRTTRAISATPVAGSGTKKITSGITAASNSSSANGSAMASPCWKRTSGDAKRVRA